VAGRRLVGTFFLLVIVCENLVLLLLKFLVDRVI
jgi:hypothetical protein